jgi:hypothetical protein
MLTVPTTALQQQQQVVPVLERDVYRPHEIEHNKRVVNIHHEAPQVSGTHTNQPISAREWEGQGHSVSGTTATTSSGLTGRRGRSGSNSSSSSDEERYETVEGVRRKKGLGEKLKEKVGLDKKDGHGDPKDAAFNNNQSGTTGYGQSTSTTGYNQGSSTNYNQGSSTTGYNQGSSLSHGTGGVGSSNTEYGADGQRKKGLGEKAKEVVGLDPKDGRDPKDFGYNSNNQSGTGYNQSSSTTGYNQGSSTTGYNQGGSTTGYNQGSSSSYGTGTSNSNTEYGADGQRKKGLAEKAKETVGLDPKDGHGDPKDIGYNNNQSTYNQGSSTTGTGAGYSTGASGGTGSSAYGQQGVGNTGYNQSSSTTGTGLGSSGVGSTGAGYNSGATTGASSGLAVEDDSTETHRKKGFGEKIKEKLGLDPKDGRDPKDGDFNTRG